jgi:serine/threonine-protein kinase
MTPMKTCPTCQKTYPDDFSLCPRDGAHLTAQAMETEAQLAAGLSRRFRLVRRLGKGGMGTVFLAEQIGVGNRPVALKVLNRKLLDDPDFLLRFQNEAGSTGRIHHPNVVTIHESAQGDDGTPYIAMEFLEGESLREVLKERGALPVTEVAEILQQAARGLNAAHKLGIIHRDLKPDNIFLTRGDDGELIVKVVDFGIAKLHESSMHTQTGMVLGTPAYMSSEQAYGMRSDELDARSDIYSLGVVVYEMLTGRLPFHSDTPAGYLRMHMLEEPPPFPAAAQGLIVPPRVEAVVMKALKKEREERYQSTLEFAQAFVAAALPAPAADISEPLPSTKVVVSPAAREPDAPMPLSLAAQGKVDTAVQTPPLAPPGRIAETPTAQPQRSGPVGGVLFSGAASIRPPAAARAPQFRTISKPPSKGKFVVIAAVALILVGAGVWYFSQPAEKNPNPDGSIKKGDMSSPTKAGPSQGEVRVNPKDGLKYVWIRSGTFMMGCSPGDTECKDDEKPTHQVTLTKGLWLGQTEVTVGSYKRFAGATGLQMPREPAFNSGWANENMPIVSVNWNHALDYCKWAGGRLPTEAEWEYAARAGSTGARSGDLDEIAWYNANSRFQTHPVGEKRANGFGLYDMLGNVAEWVGDWYDEKYYQSSPSQDPVGPTSGQERVLRGGSPFPARGFLRISSRRGEEPAFSSTICGFRCVGEMSAP